MTRVLRVLAPNPGPLTLDGTNTWIVGRDPAVVIDPGPDDPGHLLAVLDEAAPVAAILLTHRHPDHGEGAERLAQVSGARVRAFDRGGAGLRNGEVVEAGAVRIRVVHTPGHAPDHVAFFLEPERALFTGDAVLGRGTSVIDPPEGDMGAYVRSLESMRRIAPRIVYPGHGPAIFDGVAKLDEYIAHRARREEQVVSALGEGKASPEEIVPRIYGGEVPEAMFSTAARSVLAHLLKLEREGRAARTGPAGAGRFVAVTAKPCRRCGRPAEPGSRYCRRCAVAVLQEGPRRLS